MTSTSETIKATIGAVDEYFRAYREASIIDGTDRPGAVDREYHTAEVAARLLAESAAVVVEDATLSGDARQLAHYLSADIHDLDDGVRTDPTGLKAADIWESLRHRLAAVADRPEGGEAAPPITFTHAEVARICKVHNAQPRRWMKDSACPLREADGGGLDGASVLKLLEYRKRKAKDDPAIASPDMDEWERLRAEKAAKARNL